VGRRDRSDLYAPARAVFKMTWLRAPRAYILLFVITLLFRVATALPVGQTGYMDASYAVHIAENLAQGRGFTEDVLWNYLDNPAGLPHPSNLYWMPLPSILIAPFFVLFGVSYHVAQIPFILLSSILPLFAFYLSRRIFQRDDYAWAAASFTAFSGFYTIYWISPDNFAPFALTASVCLYLIARGVETQLARYFVVAGMFAALSHLSRADGVLLLAIPPLTLLAYRPTRAPSVALRFTFYVLLAYLITMSPWFIRDYFAVGTPYPNAGTKTLWLAGYDELFRYTNDLTLVRYLATGIGTIIGSKMKAGFLDALVVALGALQLFLAPFAMAGLWRIRRRIEMLPFFIYAVLLYLAMVFLFTFPSPRGSMLHSSTALLPFLAVAAPPGIDAVIEWIAQRRKTWNVAQAALFFRGGFVAYAIFLSVFLYAQGIFPMFSAPTDIPLWNERDLHYREIAAWLDRQGDLGHNARANDIVMVVDPPTFYNLSHRPAIMIPTDSIDAVFSAAKKYHAKYLILEYDHPQPLADLYQSYTNIAGLERDADFRDALGRPVTLFKVIQ
jgi:hypothetical protein